jgi:hypothetical protein
MAPLEVIEETTTTTTLAPVTQTYGAPAPPAALPPIVQAPPAAMAPLEVIEETTTTTTFAPVTQAYGSPAPLAALPPIVQAPPAAMAPLEVIEETTTTTTTFAPVTQAYGSPAPPAAMPPIVEAPPAAMAPLEMIEETTTTTTQRPAVEFVTEVASLSALPVSETTEAPLLTIAVTPVTQYGQIVSTTPAFVVEEVKYSTPQSQVYAEEVLTTEVSFIFSKKKRNFFIFLIFF